MDRRTFLETGGGAALAAGLAGCMGYDVVSSSDIEEKNQRLTEQRRRLENQSTRLESLNSSLGERQEQLQRQNQTVDSLRSRLESAEAATVTERKEAVVGLYDAGHTMSEAGTELGQQANSGLENNSGTITEIAAVYAMAGAYFQSGSHAFEKARDAAEEQNQAEARDTCETARKYALTRRNQHMANSEALNEFDKGNSDAGSRKLDEASQAKDAADSLTLESVETLRQELDLA